MHRIETKPYKGQKPGTSGLRKKVCFKLLAKPISCGYWLFSALMHLYLAQGAHAEYRTLLYALL